MNNYQNQYALDALIKYAYDKNKTDMRDIKDLTILRGFVTSIIDIVAADENAPMWKQFKEETTDKEKVAFKALYDKLSRGIGNISVVKLIQETQISRPVWTSLLTKMDKCRVAQVINQGVKGTHIEIQGDNKDVQNIFN